MNREPMAVWALPARDAVSHLDSRDEGLSTNEVESRLAEVGPNRLPQKRARSAWSILIAQFKGFLNVLLAAAAVVAWLIGDKKDALMIAVVTTFNAVLGFVQEHRAERALQAMSRLAAFVARVRRGGTVAELAADALVPGDIVLLEAGDRVPADGRLLSAHSLELDESALTGESIPTRKSCDAVLGATAALAERTNMVFMTSLVTRGRGEFIVSATGGATEVGHIARLLEAGVQAPTPLQVQLDHLGKRLAILAIAVVAVIGAFELFRGDSLAQMALEAVTLAVAAVPEGLPTVVTVTLALGVHRMAKQRAIVKKLGAVETLGCTTVICSDKTGTLTMNQMTVRSIWMAGKNFSVSGEGYLPHGDIVDETAGATANLAPLFEAVVLCNDSRVTEGVLTGDPTEGALVTLAAKAKLDVERVRAASPRIAEIPFESEHRFMATFHRDGGMVRILVKGAPGALLERSSALTTQAGPSALGEDGRARVKAANERIAEAGLRVLAVAAREIPADVFDACEDRFALVTELTLLGLIGMMDPPRSEARQAVALCKQAGISVKMITGDQRATALAIAGALGLEGGAITGAEIDQMDDAALAKSLPETAVFARVAPEHKLRIVNVLKSQQQVVAMTGDGVNDAPALRSADIGVAMGSGTEVAKEAASMVLADDNFATIVHAVQEGRTIYDNIIKFVRFQLSTNIGALLTVFLAPFFGLDAPLGPVQILWVAMISDGPPAISLGMDSARAGIMNELPRHPSARILSGARFLRLLFFGVIMAAGTLGVLWFGLRSDAAPRAPTMAFTTFVLFQVFNAFNARSEHGSALNPQLLTNSRLWIALGLVVALQLGVVHFAPLQNLFAAKSLRANDWLICIGTAATVLLAEELRKLLVRGRKRGAPGSWARVPSRV